MTTAAAILSSLSPVALTKKGGSASVLAIDEISFSPAIARTLIGHSGNRFPSLVQVPGAAPRMRFRTPFLDAYNLFGFQPVPLTAFAFFFAKFADYIRDPTAVHTKYGLAGGGSPAVAAARIVGWSTGRGGLLMADIDVVPFSGDGMTHPIAETTGQALPTLADEPTIHTIGPFVIDGTRINGLSNHSGDLGGEFMGTPTDGDLFLRNAAFIESSPTLSGQHDDPFTLLSSLGLMGAGIETAAVAYFRDIDPDSGESLATGLSISVAQGVVHPTDVAMRRGDYNKSGFNVAGLSPDDTHPFAVTTDVAIPA